MISGPYQISTHSLIIIIIYLIFIKSDLNYKII